MTLGVGTIRGVESRGMLCSAAELEISDDHEGIIDLPADAPVGMPYATYAGLDDPVIEIDLTPNRPDCTSIHGIARDLAAAGLGTLKDGACGAGARRRPCPVGVTLDFAPRDAHLCPAFALRLVRGVRNGPTPEWLQRRLTAIGLRPINALVDITNYLTFDRGRPLHVFDAAKVKGALTVRRARAGEEVLALDGRTYRLDESIVVIADENGVESIAGIMGGEHSGFDEATRDVLIESALWDPLNIAQTGRKLGIITDARYRFERGVDPAFCVPGLELATRLVLDLCGGEATEVRRRRARAGGRPAASTFPSARRAGSPASTCRKPRRRRSSRISASGSSPPATGPTVAPPSWRPDIEGKADLVEEIIRIHGLDAIEPAPLPRLEATVVKPVLTALQKRTRLAKRTLAARGLVEAVTWSFIGREEAILFGGGSERLALANPIAADLSDMRPSLLPGLLKAAQRNADRGLGDVALFEVGQCFASDEPEGQTIHAAAVRRGTARPQVVGRHWNGGAQAVAAHDAKADAMALLVSLGVPTGGLQVVPGGAVLVFHPGRSGTLQFGPKDVVGAFGEVHPGVLKGLDLKGPLVAFEITLDALPLQKARPTKMKPKLALPEFQPLTRDFAFVVPRSRRGRRHSAGSARRGARARRRRRRLRRLRGPRHRGRQEVRRRRGHPPADREDPDRRRDRSGVAEDRRRGCEEDRRVLRS